MRTPLRGQARVSSRPSIVPWLWDGRNEATLSSKGGDGCLATAEAEFCALGEHLPSAAFTLRTFPQTHTRASLRISMRKGNRPID